MQSHTLLHGLYLPHRHECIRIICHTCMHAVAYYATQVVSARLLCMQCLVCHTGMHTVALCATYACIPLHNMLCTHACKCIMCHIGTGVAAQCTTHSCIHWKDAPHIHASGGTSFIEPIQCSRDARAREPPNEPGTTCGDACLFNILMNHLVQPATRRRSSISNCRSKAQNGKWRFHRPRPHILCTGDDYAQGGEYESKYNMVHMPTPSTGLPKPMPRASVQIPKGA